MKVIVNYIGLLGLYARFVLFRDERGEIENGEHEYTINGVRYIAESAFISPEKTALH